MIEVSHLTKRYGDHTAVSDLSFTIGNRQIYGFLGPNGAGKSTTMNIMTGCLAATSGTVTIDGHDIYEDSAEARRLIGYLPEIPPLYPDRTPREYLTFVAEAKGLRGTEVRRQVAEVMEATQITEMADRLCKNLSKGYKQRVGIAQALLGNPEIIILDEPTVGLDPIQIIEIRELIRSLGKDHTVILSSHILSEVQAVCETVLIIAKGKLIACDTPDNLEKLFSGVSTVDMTVDGSEQRVQSILDGLDFVDTVEFTEVSETGCRLSVTTSAAITEDVCRCLFFAFAEQKLAILEMTTRRANLEDVFLELTQSAPESAETETTVPPAEPEPEKEASEE